MDDDLYDVIEGDEWKLAEPDGEPAECTYRAETQAILNRQYATGTIDLEEWRRRTDELSQPRT